MLPFVAVMQMADSALGRLDYDSMSQQALIELAFSKSKRSDIRDENGNFKDLSDMPQCTLDAEGNVQSVTTGFFDDVRTEWLPKTVESLFVTGLGITVDFTKLPAALRKLEVKADSSSVVDLGSLPDGLEALKIHRSSFSKLKNFCNLPKGMTKLIIMKTKIEGTLRLRELPPALTKFDFSECAFYGSIDLEELPRTLVKFDGFSNKISGSINLTNLPASL